MAVELPVDGGGVDRHIGVCPVQGVDALRAGQQAQKFDRLWLAGLQPGDRGHRRVAGCKHGVNHHNIALLHVLRHLEVILHCLQRGWVAVQPDMPHARTRHHRQHPVENAVARPQNRHKHQFFAVNLFAGHGLERGFDLYVLQRHIAADLIGHQAGELAQQPAKAVGAGLFVAHQGELVLHQGMFDEGECCAGGGVNGDHDFSGVLAWGL